MKSNLKTSVLLFVGLLGAFTTMACATNEPRTEAQMANGPSPKVGSDYVKLIEYFSAGDTEFNGLTNNFEYRATLENSVVRDASLLHQSQYYEWDQGRIGVEREKIQKEEKDGTRMFLSFFTPDHANDNLTNMKSIWKIYLDVGTTGQAGSPPTAQRYEGKIKRLRTNLAELKSLYEYHTRWATSYEVEFPVPTASIDPVVSTLTITGPLGTRTSKFPAVKP